MNVSLKQDAVSKRSNSFIQYLPSQSNVESGYSVNIEVYNYGVDNTDQIWFALIRSNEVYFNFHAEVKNVTAPLEYKCNKSSDFFKVTSRVEDRKWRLHAKMTYTPICNVDLPNIKLQLVPQHGLTIQTIIHGQNCISTSNNWFIGSILVVQYDRYYANQTICFNVTVAISNNTKLRHGSQKAIILYDIFYKTIENDVAVSKQMQQFVTIVLTDEKNSKKGFLLHDFYGACANEETDQTKDFKMGFPKNHKNSFMKGNCKSFKQNNRRLAHESGKCVKKGSKGGNVNLIKCEDADVPIEWYGKHLRWKGKESDIFMNTQAYGKTPTIDKIYRDYNTKFGLTKEPVTNTETQKSDIITVIDAKDVYYICIISKNGIQTKCFIKTPEFAKDLRRIKKVLAYDVHDRLLYCSDKKQNIIRIKDNTIRVISSKRWEFLKIRHNESLIYSKSIKRNDLVNNTVRISEKAIVTYIGLLEESKHILIWPRDTNCASNVGVNSYTALKSCNEIKRICPDARSRIYWITMTYSDNSNSGKVYCDMEFDKGGWMLIVNHTVHSQAPITPLATESLFEVVQSNYTKVYMSTVGLQRLASRHGTIINIRFYCTTADYNKTVHVSTIQNEKGNTFISYLSGHLGYNAGSACGLFNVHNDDTSRLTEDCSEIKTYISVFTYRLINNPFFKSKHNYELDTNACDTSPSNGVLKYGNWKIYVRNL